MEPYSPIVQCQKSPKLDVRYSRSSLCLVQRIIKPAATISLGSCSFDTKSLGRSRLSMMSSRKDTAAQGPMSYENFAFRRSSRVLTPSGLGVALVISLV